jgi:hypothetical protein
MQVNRDFWGQTDQKREDSIAQVRVLSGDTSKGVVPLPLNSLPKATESGQAPGWENHLCKVQEN